MEIIRSLENNKIKYFNSLKIKKNRDKEKLFIVEEKHMIQEAIKSGLLKTLIVRETVINEFDFESFVVSNEVMKKLSENSSLNDYIGICQMKPKQIQNYHRFIVLENVQDPGNVGTIIRTAYSFGYDAVLLSNTCADVYNYKTIQSSQGSFFYIPVISMPFEEIVALCKAQNVDMIGTSLHTDFSLSNIQVPNKYALVFGNEGKGLSQLALSSCKECFKIEMDNFESLNVASACAIAAYQFRYRG